MILELLVNHWIEILLVLVFFFIITAQIIPPQFAGLEKQWRDSDGNLQNNRKQSLLEAFMTAVFFTLQKALLVTIGLKGAITIILFAVVGVELVFSRTISTNAVILAIMGIVALNFENIIDQADEVSIWKIFHYKRRR